MKLLKFVRTHPDIVCVKAYKDERIVTIPPRESINISQTGGHPPVGALYPIKMREGNDREEKYYFTHVVFENKKRLRINTETAKNVVAHITFYNEDGKDVLGRDFIGRWGNSIPQPKNRADLDIEENNHWIDMLPNGTRYELDIAMKSPNENIFYAFNNTSYYFPEYRGIENKLDGKKIYVRVTLKGSNVDPQEFRFALINNIQKRSLDIEVA